MRTIILTISLLLLLLTSCKDAQDISQDASSDNAPFVDGAGKLASGGDFFVLPVSQSEFDKWNQGPANGWDLLMQGASKEFYKEMRDQFDFLFFVLDNQVTPTPITGAQIQTKNTVDGLGIPTDLDDTALYGSAGKLQSVSTLWKIENFKGGPILHEMAHRWMNFALFTNNPSHWNGAGGGIEGETDANKAGIFRQAWNEFVDIELYLMGLIPADQVVDHKDMLDDIVAAHGERSPAYPNSQQSFRGAIIVVTPNSDISAEATETMNKAIENIEDTTPVDGTVSWYKQTGGLGDLELSGLDNFVRN